MYKDGGQERSARRREAILRAALRVIGEGGTAALTHRAVAAEAGVPLAATTYYFESKDDLLEQALLLAAEEDVAELRGIVDRLADVEPGDWAATVGPLLTPDTPDARAERIARFELALEAARRPALREGMREWTEAYMRLAEAVLRAAGSPDPERDAPLLVAAFVGIDYGQLAARGRELGEADVALLQYLVERLVGAGTPA